MKQVNKKAYNFKKYSHLGRWVSYWHQLDEILNCHPKNILEIGVGNKVVANFLKSNTNIKYTSLDIAEDLNPDIIGSINNIPLPDNSFDVVCAFEVLEHLPFEKFEQSLKELKRVSKKYTLISLPHFGPMVKFSFKIPFTKEIKFAFKIPYHTKHKFNGQHYWEIGKKGYNQNKIKSVLDKFFIIKKDFIPFENQYHHFYILKKR